MEIQLEKSESSFIKRFFWSDMDNTLLVEFKNNKGYKYFDVPEDVASGFFVAESKGKFLHANIKDKYKGEPVNDERANLVNH